MKENKERTKKQKKTFFNIYYIYISKKKEKVKIVFFQQSNKKRKAWGKLSNAKVDRLVINWSSSKTNGEQPTKKIQDEGEAAFLL